MLRNAENIKPDPTCCGINILTGIQQLGLERVKEIVREALADRSTAVYHCTSAITAERLATLGFTAGRPWYNRATARNVTTYTRTGQIAPDPKPVTRTYDDPQPVKRRSGKAV